MPWAHRANAVLHLKGLEKIIQLVVMDPRLTPDGWIFSGRDGTADKDPLYGFTKIRELYFKADPDYSKRFTVPVLWDRERATIVNNESAEIIRMFYSAFDDLLPPGRRAADLPGGGYLPAALEAEIDAMNAWVYDDINNGVYRVGFASTQAAYDERVHPLFAALDRVEAHLAAAPHGGPFLFGAHITDADVRLFTTIVRFDARLLSVFQVQHQVHPPRLPAAAPVGAPAVLGRGRRDERGAFRRTTISST